MIIFCRRYGFIYDDKKYVGYLYVDDRTSRKFSVAHKLGEDTLYINEIDESLNPEDNVYSTITATSLIKAKKIIEEILNQNYNRHNLAPHFQRGD